MVGPARFELATSCTPSKRATRLRYGPNKQLLDYNLLRFGCGDFTHQFDCRRGSFELGLL